MLFYLFLFYFFLLWHVLLKWCTLKTDISRCKGFCRYYTLFCTFSAKVNYDDWKEKCGWLGDYGNLENGWDETLNRNKKKWERKICFIQLWLLKLPWITYYDLYLHNWSALTFYCRILLFYFLGLRIIRYRSLRLWVVFLLPFCLISWNNYLKNCVTPTDWLFWRTSIIFYSHSRSRTEININIINLMFYEIVISNDDDLFFPNEL